MAYSWRTSPPLSEDDRGDLGLDRAFVDQAEAEHWLTAFYADLSEAGVSTVTLMDGDRTVYGPMSLEA